MRLRTVLVLAAVGLIVLAGGVFFVVRALTGNLPNAFKTEGCSVTTSSGAVDLTTEQMAQAFLAADEYFARATSGL